MDSKLDEALDRLADMGLSALMSQTVEPIAAAMIAKSQSELANQQGTKAFFSDYWSFARAVARAFDEPQIASRLARMFFASAGMLCKPWADFEKIDGRSRMKMGALRELATAAMAARDANFGAYANEMIEAMVARDDEEASGPVQKAIDALPKQSPKGWEALEKELGSSFVWIEDEHLEARFAALSSHQNAGIKEIDAFFIAADERSASRGNHGVLCSYALRLMCLGARSSQAWSEDEAAWARLLDEAIDGSDQARAARNKLKAGSIAGVSNVDEMFLSSWSKFSGSAAERTAHELGLGALEMASAGRFSHSVLAMKALRELFFGRGKGLNPAQEGPMRNMAQALCNRMIRDGAAACLPKPAAVELFEMGSHEVGPPKSWTVQTDPETVAWMVGSSGRRPSVDNWIELAQMTRLGCLDSRRQEQWAKAIETNAWGHPSDDDLLQGETVERLSMGIAMIQTLGSSTRLGGAMLNALDPGRQAGSSVLGRMQDLLSSLDELGASDSACQRASEAMGEALASLERALLAGQMGRALSSSSKVRI